MHLLQIASHGSVVITYAPTRPDQLRAAIDWTLAESERSGSRYFGLIDPDAIAVSGFSCGGMQSLVVADWLDWQLRGSREAARRFVGRDCGLCADPQWSYESKGF